MGKDSSEFSRHTIRPLATQYNALHPSMEALNLDVDVAPEDRAGSRCF